MIQSATHNQKINLVYGGYNFWSWLRYWHIDSIEWVTLMLIDKEYYDCDYTYVEPKAEQDIKLKSEEEQQAMFSKFGFGKVRSVDNDVEKLQESLIQAMNIDDGRYDSRE